jgi:mandelate racemase
VKIKIGAGEVSDDVALVAAVRKAIGPEARLMIDFNQSQTTVSAIERTRRLQEFDLTWVEEPVAADDLRGHRAVREGIAPIPIQTGENWWFPQGMANAIAAGACDLAMIDIMKIGGSRAGSPPWRKPRPPLSRCLAICSWRRAPTHWRPLRPPLGLNISTSQVRS